MVAGLDVTSLMNIFRGERAKAGKAIRGEAWLVWRELMLNIISYLSVVNIYYVVKTD